MHIETPRSWTVEQKAPWHVSLTVMVGGSAIGWAIIIVALRYFGTH